MKDDEEREDSDRNVKGRRLLVLIVISAVIVIGIALIAFI